MSLRFRLDGDEVEVADDGTSLLEVLRDGLGRRTVKDGCSPQGQCGCCTVLVDGAPRVACVTPARRIAGRSVTTLDGLPAPDRDRWAGAFTSAGASQCGFCTPGIVLRLMSLETRAGAGAAGAVPPGPAPRPGDVETALLAHLCRCTGWRTILEAAAMAMGGQAADRPAPAPPPPSGPARPAPTRSDPTHAAGDGPRDRDLDAASVRATLEGGTPQRVGPTIALGNGGFADDTAPPDALVAVPDGGGGWAVGETLAEARAAAKGAGKVPGRRSGAALVHPLEVPPGDWDLRLRTTWVEPAYVETDASWCRPGGEPTTPLGNGGAFGGKLESVAPAAARELASRYGRPVRVLLSRDDTVRMGPKRPPVAAGVRADGSGVMRVARTPGLARAVTSVAPALAVEEIDVPGPPTSPHLRAAGWAEAAVLLAAAGRLEQRGSPAAGARADLEATATVRAPNGAAATAAVRTDADGRPAAVAVEVECGAPLDEVVLRSYAVGATHMALGWVCSEGLAVDAAGVPQDLTIRSFGILRARDTPPVEVTIRDSGGPAVNGSDAVFAAVAAATWLAQGLPAEWPTMRWRFN